MELELVSDDDHRRKVVSKVLFRQVYKFVDGTIRPSAPRNQVAKFEKWRQVRKVVGEYIGNLHKHDAIVTKVFLDLDWVGPLLKVKILHDGDDHDQLQLVTTIRAGLLSLGAQPTVAFGTGSYRGFCFDVSFA